MCTDTCQREVWIIATLLFFILERETRQTQPSPARWRAFFRRDVTRTFEPLLKIPASDILLCVGCGSHVTYIWCYDKIASTLTSHIASDTGVMTTHVMSQSRHSGNCVAHSSGSASASFCLNRHCVWWTLQMSDGNLLIADEWRRRVLVKFHVKKLKYFSRTTLCRRDTWYAIIGTW